ncbi:enoyl-CoA delta isomerase 1, mitochondrial-like [Zeugodacus cucurbitae]|uniref:Enoyl-CoA delta isomerase 1, mitochondrial n=1 Tax=Zeugodacus cucurbitae TaxID=28588 RepID=A0A0A1X255_ZEUCU|nr:enoyl-CoA delta isomerase 1, mitochondrial-like [Zeugodacus cucurbitae]
MATRIMHLPTHGLRRLVKPSALARNYTASAGSASPPQFTTLSVDDKTGIATLTLNRPPANALNAAFMGEVARSIKATEQSKCRGLILTSSSERIFCAGLDLKECYKAETSQLQSIWCALQNLWRTIYSTPLITVALINGHTVAGGSMLALSSEYRIMLPNFKIGINETMVGLAVPQWLIDTYLNVNPNRRVAEWDLTASRMYSSEGALKTGLVDELVANKEQALERAVAFINGYPKHSLVARAITKQQFRAAALRNFEDNRQHDLEMFLSTIQKPEVQSNLGAYLESLKKKA